MTLNVVGNFMCPACDQIVLVDERSLWECLVCGSKGHIDAQGTVWMQSPEPMWEMGGGGW